MVYRSDAEIRNDMYREAFQRVIFVGIIQKELQELREEMIEVRKSLQSHLDKKWYHFLFIGKNK